MKKLMMITCMMFGCAYAASAKEDVKVPTSKTSSKVENKVAALVEKRAENLSDKMVRELRLNNYQSRKVRAINLEVVAQKMAVEKEFAGNQETIDQKCKEICNMRDVALEDVLSTEQYNDYFGSRKTYDQVEKDFMAAQTANTVDAGAYTSIK
ncbi:hypothetical protein I2I11_10855 [Pontibacter sp. 172403-2]|uniref:hypothetical protein n=1 Tax=Pontibacter rufus TaxID=2791028 RepID=UPI0018AF73E8|nr:hypothetical protein [Pontibacter sp. 172403-2]MBF9253793.1 hypothetical protein [Pontibacter sp. 172403-2]